MGRRLASRQSLAMARRKISADLQGRERATKKRASGRGRFPARAGRPAGILGQVSKPSRSSGPRHVRGIVLTATRVNKGAVVSSLACPSRDLDDPDIDVLFEADELRSCWRKVCGRHAAWRSPAAPRRGGNRSTRALAGPTNRV